MAKLNVSQILVKDAKLKAEKLDPERVASILAETKKKQEELLKLKEVGQDELKQVVQLY